MADESKMNLMDRVLIERYQSAHRTFALELLLFRFLSICLFISVVVMPVQLSPLALALVGLALSLFWAFRMRELQREIRGFDGIVVDLEGKQEDNRFTRLYIEWRHACSSSSPAFGSVVNLEPILWPAMYLSIAIVRGV